MRVKPNQLQIGCIVSKDVLCASNQVLMRKKTVLKESDLEVLMAFLISAVDVEATLVNGNPFTPKEIIEVEEDNKVDKKQESRFLDLYLNAVKSYKKMFLSWQAGAKVDILAIRKILLPLIEKFSDRPEEITSLHHYATKQEYIFHHAVSVGVLAAYVGRKLNYSKPEEIQLGIAGMMADSGMARISNAILDKKGPLTATEFEEIKNHPMFSYQMIKEIQGITDGVLLGVLQHHEREDGTGYPMALTTNKLHKFSRVIAVIDVFHAMASERYYKVKQSPYAVIEAIAKENFGKFDIKVVQMLSNTICNFSVGQKIRLNNDEIAEIIFLEPHSPTRPMIKLEGSGEFIKLDHYHDLYIEEVL